MPKNDPQFKAMEADFADRKRKRQKDKKLADELKAKGNDAFKKGLYKSAKHHYSEALEHKKDYLQIYNNRALVCIKLEDMQQAIDDTTRVLEYCEVFEDGYTKQRDLCYKALIRRGQALKFQKDFDLAIADYKEAIKLGVEAPEECQKWIERCEADREHHEKITKIMENADSLAGKEYLDYLLKFLKGSLDSASPQKRPKNVKQVCFHELTTEEVKKLESTLKDENLVYYWSVQGGFKMLVDSLYFATNSLPLLQTLLEKNPKLQDDFQKEHLYEALIDFLQF